MGQFKHLNSENGINWGSTRVRLQVLSVPGGELLSERIFYISDVEDYDNSMIRAFPDRIEYFDNDQASLLPYVARTIPLPPTWLDWLRARLP